MKDIIIFPGSIELYEQIFDYKVSVIDTKRSNKGVVLHQSEIGYDTEKDCTIYGNLEIDNDELNELLVNEGIEAIVNANFSRTDYLSNCGSGSYIFYYGLPIRRRE